VSRLASRDPAVVRLTARLSRSDLLWVANTAHGPGGHWYARARDGQPDHDHLRTAKAATTYLADHRVPIPTDVPDRTALRELGVVRAMVERLVADGEPWTATGLALLATARYAIDADGRVASAEAGWRGFCRDLLLPFHDLAENRADLRRCANPACRLLFEDGSRNHARRWCDTTGCGNRDRVRRARDRRVGATERGQAPR
jgi:hypothetical protein